MSHGKHREPFHVWMYESFFGIRDLTNKVFNPFHWANRAFTKWDYHVRDNKINALRILEKRGDPAVKGLTSQLNTNYFPGEGHEVKAAMAFMGRYARAQRGNTEQAQDKPKALERFGVKDEQRLTIDEARNYWQIASLRNELLAEARSLLRMEMDTHQDHKQIEELHHHIEEGRHELERMLSEHEDILVRGAQEYEALRNFHSLPSSIAKLRRGEGLGRAMPEQE